MSAAIRESIDRTFGFEAVCINSALVSAQNRQRLYWVGMRNNDGTYRKVPVDQPENRYVLLRDILDGQGIDLTCNEKAYTLTASYNGAVAWNTIERSQRNMVCEPVQVGALPRPNGELSTSQAFRIYDINAKSITINANGGGAGGKTGLYAIPIEFDGEKPVKAMSGTDGETYIVYEVKDGFIIIRGKQYQTKLADGFYIIRKLTVTECMRLQTVPEWYDFSVISNAQAYKCLGNGWTCDVITHLINATQTAARKKWLYDLLK